MRQNGLHRVTKIEDIVAGRLEGVFSDEGVRVEVFEDLLRFGTCNRESQHRDKRLCPTLHLI